MCTKLHWITCIHCFLWIHRAMADSATTNKNYKINYSSSKNGVWFHGKLKDYNFKHSSNIFLPQSKCFVDKQTRGGQCHKVFSGLFVLQSLQCLNTEWRDPDLNDRPAPGLSSWLAKNRLLFLFLLIIFVCLFLKRHCDIQRLWEWRESDELGKGFVIWVTAKQYVTV